MGPIDLRFYYNHSFVLISNNALQPTAKRRGWVLRSARNETFFVHTARHFRNPRRGSYCAQPAPEPGVQTFRSRLLHGAVLGSGVLHRGNCGFRAARPLSRARLEAVHARRGTLSSFRHRRGCVLDYCCIGCSTPHRFSGKRWGLQIIVQFSTGIGVHGEWVEQEDWCLDGGSIRGWPTWWCILPDWYGDGRYQSRHNVLRICVSAQH